MTYQSHQSEDVSLKTTPSSKWRVNGEPDPHAGKGYDGERAQLCMGDLTDDEVANGVFLFGDGTHGRPTVEQLLAGTHKFPIVWLTAAKERIRWLSRALEKELTKNKVLQDEVDADDALLKNYAALMGMIPACEEHGVSCIPHAVQWVAEQVAGRAEARWIPITECLPESAEDRISCEAWCEGTEGGPAGPCIMMYDPDTHWQSREDTGCWEPGEVTHWRPRAKAPT